MKNIYIILLFSFIVINYSYARIGESVTECDRRYKDTFKKDGGIIFNEQINKKIYTKWGYKIECVFDYDSKRCIEIKYYFPEMHKYIQNNIAILLTSNYSNGWIKGTEDKNKCTYFSGDHLLTAIYDNYENSLYISHTTISFEIFEL